ncbi:glucose-6-phosphate isomerase [Dichotomicrobium thermohalophilum]|uniref:Glucose-6-phosphate isomerase n=1 Tax=Dichotomicrobium thermohalophilum TaxID=933063 RepID=A0A397PNR5_9HYPH|nr:glucose-6-phosphate isomerase [Dichotomicrobium thermohalophilum]RIA47381.1 glucose-6-phosphate isomerase [Dichotomicrobium thermohalophilum]
MREMAGTMTFHHDITGCLDERIGARGLAHAALDARLHALEPKLAELRESLGQGGYRMLGIARENQDIETTRAALERLFDGAKTLVVFGTGGSSLGGQTLARLAGWCIPGDQRPAANTLPRVRFYDNLDPLSLQHGLNLLDPETTRFLVISKSGGTAETLMQALSALDWMRRADMGHMIPRAFLGLSEPAREGTKNPLRQLFEGLGVPLLDHDPEIGGRFSVFSNVGMIVALARGLDAHAIRDGGRQVLDELESQSAADFAPAVGAATAVALAEDKGVRVNVMMPYADRLSHLARWYVQLWAESLGKDGKGTTPLAALGPVDQHSQLQLFMDGPPDHMITLIRPAHGRDDPPMPADLAEMAGAENLAGRRVSELVSAQQQAIGDALMQAGRPVRVIDVDNPDETTLGHLLMHMMVETILAGHLLGVDPFGQPGVELGKKLTREYLAASDERDSAHSPARRGAD